MRGGVSKQKTHARLVRHYVGACEASCEVLLKFFAYSRHAPAQQHSMGQHMPGQFALRRICFICFQSLLVSGKRVKSAAAHPFGPANTHSDALRRVRMRSFHLPAQRASYKGASAASSRFGRDGWETQRPCHTSRLSPSSKQTFLKGRSYRVDDADCGSIGMHGIEQVVECSGHDGAGNSCQDGGA